MRFQPFTPVRVAILAAVPLAAGALAALARRRPGALRGIRVALAAGIAANELAWYGFVLAQGWVDPPHGLPLDLCDVAVWLTVFVLAAPRPWALDLAWYVGIAGSGMAVLTPDVGAALASYPGVKFFASHGVVVASLLFLAFAGALRPRPGSWWRAFLAVNGWAGLVALVNAAYGTNYMYLRAKPESGTLLDLLGPWPWYILGGEVVALALLALLYLPFRRRAGERGRAGA
jgi:hypothetical integral membrane protein (TIGR02206 family)